MNFTVNRNEMLDAVKTALRAATNNKNIPEIAGVLVEADVNSGIISVTGTDVRTQIQRRIRCEHISESGSLILNPIISEMLKLLGGETVEFSSSALSRNMIEVKSGTCIYTVPFLEAKSFPKMQLPFPDDFICIKGLNSLIKRTVFAAEGKTDNQSRVAMQFVKLTFANGNTRAEATDGNCIAVSDSPHCADGNLELILHEKALNTLSLITNPTDDMYVGTVGKFAVFIKEDLFFSTMMHDGNYIEGSKIVERLMPVYKATTDAKQMYDLAGNVATIFSTGDDPCINVRIGSDNISMHTITATGSSNAQISASDTVPTPDVGFNYKAKFLLDCLRHTSGPLKVSVDSKGFMIFEANQSQFVVCPRGPVHIVVKNEEKPKKTRAKKTKTAAVAAAA